MSAYKAIHIMLMFLVCFVFATVVSGEEFGENGLHFDSTSEYAPKYDNYAPRDYHFDYFVSDPHTGDHKSQWEVKEKGVVRGGYSLVEPDGSTRIVEYIADDHGFRAVVKKIGSSLHPEHVESHGHVAPLEAPHYHAYDGHVNNYANILSEKNQYQLQPIEIPEKLPENAPEVIDQAEVPVNLEKNPIVFYGHDEPKLVTYDGIPEPQVLLHNYHLGIQKYDPIQPYAESGQYHGMTNNPDDDSKYTEYDDYKAGIQEYGHLTHEPAWDKPLPYQLLIHY